MESIFCEMKRVLSSPTSKRFRAALTMALAVFGLSASPAQQDPGLRDKAVDSAITGQQASEILNELRAIRHLLEKQSVPTGRGQLSPILEPPLTGKLRLGGGYSLGSKDAPVTIVEFTDYQCSYCRAFESATLAEIRKKYIDTGKVKFVVRDFPLVDIHADAMRAAEAAHCAGDQGKFWSMHEVLFSDTSNLGKNWLIDSAAKLKLDVEAFQACLESESHKSQIQNDQQIASSLQISATPSFLIGKTTGDELYGIIMVGAQPFSVFETKIREAKVAH